MDIKTVRGRMRKTPIRKQSVKQAQRQRAWNKLVVYLIQFRARGLCEICGKPPTFTGLQGHHIIHRSQGGKDLVANAIIGCGDCHSHSKFASGIPLSIDDALEKVRILNEKYGIKEE